MLRFFLLFLHRIGLIQNAYQMCRTYGRDQLWTSSRKQLTKACDFTHKVRYLRAHLPMLPSIDMIWM